MFSVFNMFQLHFCCAGYHSCPMVWFSAIHPVSPSRQKVCSAAQAPSLDFQQHSHRCCSPADSYAHIQLGSGRYISLKRNSEESRKVPGTMFSLRGSLHSLNLFQILRLNAAAMLLCVCFPLLSCFKCFRIHPSRVLDVKKAWWYNAQVRICFWGIKVFGLRTGDDSTRFMLHWDSILFPPLLFEGPATRSVAVPGWALKQTNLWWF